MAEATKLLENTFRAVNIAWGNELKILYSAMGIDVWDVINAAKTKPFGLNRFTPDPDWAGTVFRSIRFTLLGEPQHTRFIELAGEINTAMPEYVVQRVAGALNDRRKPINGRRVLVARLAYKPDVDDERKSPSYVLMELLREQGAGGWCPCIVETRNALANVSVQPGQVTKV